MLVLLMMVSGCGRHQTPAYVKMVDQIRTDYSRFVLKNDQLIMDGFGGRMMGDVQSIMLSFDSFSQPDISEARQLIVCKTEEFLLIINNHQDIRPFLHNYPFDATNFDLKIGFLQPTGKFVDPPYIAYASVISGIIYYSVYDSQMKRLERIHSESYEEACRQINNQSENSTI